MDIGEGKIIIQGGRIVDGTGKPAYPGDVVISGDKIQDVTPPEIIAKEGEYEVFSAVDCIVCPGFIDAHAHDDIALLEFPDQNNKIRMGVTTVINGNCGVSVAPLIQENLENICETVVLVKSGKHCFTTIRDYLAILAGKPPKTNYAAFIGHNTLRVTALRRYMAEPSPEEMVTMREMVREAMEMGALGLSTWLAYVPGLAASTWEVVDLAKVVSEYGGIYSTHLRNEGDKLEDAVSEAIDIALRYTTPYPISLGGLSTGGALSVHRALHRQGEVSGALYLFSAALGLAGVLGDMKELFLRSGILCDIVARYEDKSFVERFQDLLFFFGLADEPGAASRLVGDNPYRYRRMDMDGAAQLSELIRQLDSVLRDTVPQQPVFAVHSECDSTAALAPVEELVRRGSGELYRIDRSFGVAHASVVLRDDILSSSDPSRVLEGKNPVFGAMTGALGRFVHETDSSHAS